MPLILLNTFSGISDRMAGAAGLLKFAINSGMGTTNGTGMYQRIHQGSDALGGNYPLENAFITDANTIDNNTVSGSLFKAVWGSIIQDMDSYFVNQGFTNTDNYLSISGNPIGTIGTLTGQGNLGSPQAECQGVHVQPNFEDIYFQVRGSHLSAGNVMFAQDNVLVAKYDATGSGTGTFTSVNPVGTNTGTVSPTNHAPSKFLLITSGNMGPASAQVNLLLSSALAAPGAGLVNAAANILIPGSSVSGSQFAVNTSGQYLNCTNMVVTGGTNGDEYQVWAIRERVLSL